MTTEGELSSNSNGISTVITSEETEHSQSLLLDGYDLPVFGLEEGHFYSIHITALVCIVSSFICATLSIVFSFKHHDVRQFYKKWTKSDRFVVYLALCDALFNVSHSLDHSHILLTKDHVRPRALCVFYSFNISVFITAQMLLVNIVALNAFMLLYFNIHINFGCSDWKLLLWTFGAPFLGSVVAASTNQFGPTGSYCYFDGVKGIAALWFTTIPLLIIITMNIVLYALTWKRIHQHATQIMRTIGRNTQSAQASTRTARSMSLFVAAFFIQWMPLGAYSAWALFDSSIPLFVLYVVILFSNIGGCLNLAVFVFIRRSRQQEQNERTPSSRVQLSSIS